MVEDWIARSQVTLPGDHGGCLVDVRAPSNPSVAASNSKVHVIDGAADSKESVLSVKLH